MKRTWMVFCLVMVLLLGSGVQGMAQQIVLRVASGQDVTEIEIREAIARMYEEQNPNVRIEMEYLAGNRFERQQQMITGGNAPDILYLNQPFLAVWASHGVLVDLTEYIERDNFTFEGIHPRAVDLVTYEDRVWAMPFEIAPMAMLYNKNLFAEAGLDAPPKSWTDPNWTWDALLDVAKKLTLDRSGDGRIDQFGMDMDQWKMRSYLRQNAATVINEDGTESTIDTPEAREALQWMQDVMYKHRVAPSPELSLDTPTFSQFMTGRLGMFHFGRWLNAFTEIQDFEWDVAPMAYNRQPGTLMPVLHYAISTQSQHPDVAWDFLKFLITKEPQVVNTLSGMAVPVLRSVAESDVLLDSGIVESEFVWWEGVNYGYPEEDHPRFFEWNAALNRELEAIWMNEDSVASVTSFAKEIVDDILSMW